MKNLKTIFTVIFSFLITSIYGSINIKTEFNSVVVGKYKDGVEWIIPFTSKKEKSIYHRIPEEIKEFTILTPNGNKTFYVDSLSKVDNVNISFFKDKDRITYNTYLPQSFNLSKEINNFYITMSRRSMRYFNVYIIIDENKYEQLEKGIYNANGFVIENKMNGTKYVFNPANDNNEIPEGYLVEMTKTGLEVRKLNN